MAQSIDVTGLAPATVQAVESLVAVLRSQASGANPSQSATAKFPPKVARMLDTDYHAECEADDSPEITLAEVRAGLASIPGDMTADFSAEREDR